MISIPVFSNLKLTLSKNPLIFVILYLLVLLALRLYVAQFILVSIDVVWRYFEASKILLGERLYVDILTFQSPFLVYFYVPAVYLAKPLSLDGLFVMQMYVLTLASMILLLVWRITSALFTRMPTLRNTLVAVFLAYAFLLIAGSGYMVGQKSHLFLIFISPYIFSVLARVYNVEIPSWILIISGLLASLGSFIKPHYLVLILLLEFYKYLRTQRIEILIH